MQSISIIERPALAGGGLPLSTAKAGGFPPVSVSFVIHDLAGSFGLDA